MRILWDFRLYSYGYGSRGVGRHAFWTARSVINYLKDQEIFLWADRSCLPAEMLDWPVTWVPYTRGSWRTDLIRIPLLAKKLRVDLVHHWIVLGPLLQIGLSMPVSRTLGTVYDLGVEYWEEDPFLTSRQGSRFWRLQRLLACRLEKMICISESTRSDLLRALPYDKNHIEVIYPPFPYPATLSSQRNEQVLVTLGGSPTKNLGLVIRAFRIVRRSHPGLVLAVCGALSPREKAEIAGLEGVCLEPMLKYEYYLERGKGLILFSRHEGLGMPALEAIHYGCPLIVSDKLPLRKMLPDAARFVRANDPIALARGIQDVLGDTESWEQKACGGAAEYAKLSGTCGERLSRLYRGL